MCGRFANKYKWKDIHALLDAHVRLDAPAAGPDERYNISPTQMIPVLKAAGGGLLAADMRWKLVPSSWSAPLEKMHYNTILAKIETAASSGLFKAAVAARRCLVPVSSFYEWKTGPDGKKQPYAIGHVDGAPLLLGGIWSHWRGSLKGEVLDCDTVAICTTEPNSFMAQIHNRMPVIIQPADAAAWLFGPLPSALMLATDYPSQLMRKWPVSTAVNDWRNQGPQLCYEIVAP